MRKAGQSRELGKKRERVVSNRGDRGVSEKVEGGGRSGIGARRGGGRRVQRGLWKQIKKS